MRHGTARRAKHGNGSAQTRTRKKPAELGPLDAVKISERERASIGQQLHDDTCQVLAGLACFTEALALRVKTAPVAATAQELRDFGRQLRSAGDRVRALAHALVPVPSTRRGLRRALAEAVDQAVLLYPVKIVLDLPSVLHRHRGNHVVQLHGITQESIANALRHGGATRIRIRLRVRGENHVLEIHDNGCGLPRNFARKQGIGMHLMKERAQAIGARITVGPAASHGVKVRVRYSLA